MYKQFGINEEVIELAHKTEEQVKEKFKRERKKAKRKGK